MRTEFICVLLMVVSCKTNHSGHLHEYSLDAGKMGTAFQVTAVSEDLSSARSAVEAAYREIDRIEALISDWKSTSEISAINLNAGVRAVEVSEEVYDLVARSKKISELTGGLFDVSYASMDAIWKFDGSMRELPSEEAIRRSVSLIGYEHIIMDPEEHTIYLDQPGMKIGLGGIGKGYAANKCKKIMEEMGIRNGVVNAGGDLIVWGKQANGEAWTIGIANPAQKNSAFSWLEISDMSVVTSGNYERYVEFNGKRYSHIIDPRTGWPAEALKSVTVICPDAEAADALATAVFIMGVEKGVAFVNTLQNVECIIVDGNDKLHCSENIALDHSDVSP